MAVITVLRNDLRELMQQIALHVGVRVLVHEYSRGRMRDVYDTYTLAHLGAGDRSTYA